MKPKSKCSLDEQYHLMKKPLKKLEYYKQEELERQNKVAVFPK